jgi:hypothetical protein
MALTFVPMTIAGLSGVAGADAGVASGLINTSRQIGGAVGLAMVTTITAGSAGGGAMHGFDAAFIVLTALAIAGAAIAARFIASPPRPAAVERLAPDTVEALEEAA